MLKNMNECRKKRQGTVIYCLIAALTLTGMFFGAAEFFSPENISVIKDGDIYNETAPAQVISAGETDAVYDYTAMTKLFGVIPIKEVDVSVFPDISLVPSGEVFGVKFFTKGVMIIGISELEGEDGIFSPATAAGLKVKDIITSVDSKEVNTIEELSAKIEASGGKSLTVKYLRDGNEYTTEITPLLTLVEKKYKSGLWVRDSTAGIGTMTYYNPKNNVFSGLGHGICDVDTGELMPLLRGTVVDVTLQDVVLGEEGKPGELKGSFGFVKKGTLLGNTRMGVYGVLDKTPDDNNRKALPICLKDNIKEGKATILSDVDGIGVAEYEIEITKIYHNSEDTKNFIIKVTDEKLIEKTGGIVQGMSGSPVIQNGKLVGAVTHVLVSDPKKGYGIFIENMLKSMPDILK